MRYIFSAVISACLLSGCGGGSAGSDLVSDTGTPSVFGLYTYTQPTFQYVCTGSVETFPEIDSRAAVTQSGSGITITVGTVEFTGSVETDGQFEASTSRRDGNVTSLFALRGAFTPGSWIGVYSINAIDLSTLATCSGDSIFEGEIVN